MAREVVTGYCWPQSVSPGNQVGLHLSSSGGRTVRVEVARVGARREIVFSADAVEAEEHAIPKDAASKGCGWPAALILDVDPTWRSGYYEVVMGIGVGGKVRRDYAFFVVRPSPGARIVLALGNQYVARLQRLWWTELVHRRHTRVHAAADVGRLSPQASRQGPSRHGDRGARSSECRSCRLHPAQPSVGLGRVGGLARLGAPVHRMG